MDINGLMIGDWVQVCNSDHLNVVQIDGILSQSIFTKEGEYESEEINVTNIRPIPLIPEILLKNGYEDKGSYYECENLAIFKPFPIAFPGIEDMGFGCGKVIRETNGNMRNIVFCNVKYVHQLQHLYKLAGSDIEIEI